MYVNDIFLERLPKIDLHGCCRESARVMVNDFIDEAYTMGYERVVIIHGIGSGIIKKEVQDVLKRNKKVESFYIDYLNVGCTVANVKKV